MCFSTTVVVPLVSALEGLPCSIGAENKIRKMYLFQSYLVTKKDIEVQPGFEPRSSECRSDALPPPTEEQL